MKATQWALLVAALCVSSTFPEASLHAQTTPKTNDLHCLWKVDVKTHTLYLFGSIHFLKKSLYPLAPVIEQAYQKSGAVAFETDLEELKSPKLQLQMLMMGKCPEGETLAKRVSAETYSKLQTYLKEAGLPGMTFDAFKPWFAAVGLLAIELQKLGFDPSHGVDQHFFDAARKDKKPTIALETPEFQLKLFAEFTKEDDEAMLKESIQEIGTFKTLLDDIVQAWKTGDADKLDKLVVETMREFPDLYKKLLVERNQRWVENLEKRVAPGQDIFVVVGAAHLVGKDSVVEMFRKKGFAVEQK